MSQQQVEAPSVISDKDGFQALLGQAIRETEQLRALDRSWQLPNDILGQLLQMRAATAGDVPDPKLQCTLDIGAIAALNFEGHSDRYASLLKQLNYTFRRYHLLMAPLPAADCAVPLNEAEGEGRLARRGILQLYMGPDGSRKVCLNAGEKLVVGSSERAQWVLAKDKQLSGRHLEFCWDGLVMQVRDLAGVGGIRINGLAALRGELQNGGIVEAGGSVLRFFVESHTPAETTERVAAAAAVVEALRDDWQRGRLYAVVDAARARRVLQLLDEAVDEHWSLYEGPAGRALDDSAPYLVQLRPDSGLLNRLLGEGWGHAWGLLLASDETPKMVRRSLRRLLMVEAETRTGRLYFRFYDPRVMARFMPVATPRQRSEFMAAADTIWFEDGAGQLQTTRREAS